jgi:Membrane domain of glycerophosphoryl diester phosphodiesterase
VYEKASAPRSIGGVIDDGIRLSIQSFPRTWMFAAATQVAIGIPILLFKVQAAPGAAPDPQAALALFRSPAFWLCYIVALVVSFAFNNAIIAQTDSTASNAPLSLGNSMAVGFRLLPRTALLLLAIALAFGVLGAAVVVPMAFIGVGLRVVGAIVLFLSFFYLIGRFYFATQILVVEDAAVFASLERSWILTKGHWWRAATILTVVVIMFGVFLLVIGFIAGLVAATVGKGSFGGLIATQVLSMLGNTVITPFISGAALAIYYDLKLRNEGGDLAQRAGALA